MNYTLPLEMLYRWEKERADEIYLSQPIDGKIHEWSWKETSNQVRKMASKMSIYFASDASVLFNNESALE